MSTETGESAVAVEQEKLESVEPAQLVSAEQVGEYLKNHPDFFVEHTALLDELVLPHQRGTAVSLVERQVQQLRQRKNALEHQLHQLLHIARDNERIARQMHHFAVELLHVGNRDELIAMVREQALRQFRADEFVLLLIDEHNGVLDLRGSTKVLPADAPLLAPFAPLLHKGNPQCGRISAEQRQLLFNDEDLQSSAVIPLSAGRSLGLLGLASLDADHFAPDKGGLFLQQLGELVSAALARSQEACAEEMAD